MEQATEWKANGNQFVAKGQFAQAVSCYNSGIDLLCASSHQKAPAAPSEEGDGGGGADTSSTGKAWNFVRQIVALGQEEEAKCSKIKAVAIDDMWVLAKKMIEKQAEFEQANRPTFVDVGYPYTRATHLVQISQDGLLSREEREAKKVKVKLNGAAFGEGIYTGCNETTFRHYGDVGLLVARLQGETVESFEGAPTGDHDTVIGYGIWSHHGEMKNAAIVLRTSPQCVALIQYETALVQGDSKSEGKKRIRSIQAKLQRIIDSFFNEGKQPTTTSFAMKDCASAVPKYEKIEFTHKAERPPLPVTTMFEWTYQPQAPGCIVVCCKCNVSGADISAKSCGHRFHTSCLFNQKLRKIISCPTCIDSAKKTHHLTMPEGKMNIIRSSTLTKSSEGTIVIQYYFSEGTLNGNKHPHALATTFLPDNDEGQKLLKRFIYAFRNGLTFTVQNNLITWRFRNQKTTLCLATNSYLGLPYMKLANQELDTFNVPAADNL